MSFYEKILPIILPMMMPVKIDRACRCVKMDLAQGVYGNCLHNQLAENTEYISYLYADDNVLVEIYSLISVGDLAGNRLGR